MLPIITSKSLLQMKFILFLTNKRKWDKNRTLNTTLKCLESLLCDYSKILNKLLRKMGQTMY